MRHWKEQRVQYSIITVQALAKELWQATTNPTCLDRSRLGSTVPAARENGPTQCDGRVHDARPRARVPADIPA
jgi:hypothetical protein